MKAARISRSALRQIVSVETRPHGAVQLRRHRAVGLIVDAPQHLLTQRVIQLAVLVLKCRGHQRPAADKCVYRHYASPVKDRL